MLSFSDNSKKPSSPGGASTVSVRAAITGASCRLPGAENLSAFWDLMKARRHGLRKSPQGRYEALELTPRYIESLEEIGHHWGGYLDDPDMFDPVVFGMSRAEASSTDPQHRLLMEVVWEALENGCEAPDSLAGSRTGVFVGLSSFDYAMFLSAFDPYGALITPFSSPGAVHSIAANRISYMLDLRGPSFAVDSACSSSSYALHMALQSLKSGECDAAIVCGANMIMTPYITKGFKRARMLSKDGIVKSFDETTDGYVRAEGAVAFVIRREEDAVARGNRIMGVISGSAVNHDGKTAGLASPSCDRQVELIRAAHEAAGVDQSAIGLVEAHGTGTYRGDETELKALNTVFEGERGGSGSVGPCHVQSVKANVGHLEAVSGLAGVLKTVLCLEKEEIPGQANLNQPMPEALVESSRVVVSPDANVWARGESPRRAGVSCLGFGGANSHFVVEEAPKMRERTQCAERPYHVLKLSAKKPEQVGVMAANLRDALVDRSDFSIGDVCYSANIGRADFEERALVVARSGDELMSALDVLASGTDDPAGADIIYKGRAKRSARKVAILLSCAMSARVGMCGGLFSSEPVFSAVIRDADQTVSDLAGVTLSELLYGGDLVRMSLIEDAGVSRVVMLAVQVGLAKLLAHLGVEATFVVSGGVADHAHRVLAGKTSFVDGLKAAFHHADADTDSAFKEALEETLEGGADLLIETGPSSDIVAELVSGVEEKRGLVVTSCFFEDDDDCLKWGRALGQIYTAGANIDWHAFDHAFDRERLVLPTYAFSRERFWFSDEASMPGTVEEQASASVEAQLQRVVELNSSAIEMVSASNGSGQNGVHLNGSGSNGSTVNGSGSNGHSHNGSGANGAAMDGVDLNGVDTNGLGLNGSGQNGSRLTGHGMLISRADLFGFVRDSLAAATLIPASEIEEDTTFMDVELDSIAGLELLLRIDKKLGVMPDPEMFAEDMTFGAAIDALHDLVTDKPTNGRGLVSASGLNGEKPAQCNGTDRVGASMDGESKNGILNGDLSNGHDRVEQKIAGDCDLAVGQTESLLSEITAQMDPKDYLKSIRPDFTAAMHEMLLDVDFDTALGDRVSGSRYGKPVEAIDMLGGFGSTLFGHNHPALVAILKEALDANRPKFMQMSNRTAAGTLAKEIIQRLSKLTGRDYKAVLGSTGAEMVDAALKHTLFEWSQRRQTFVEGCDGVEGELPTAVNQQPVVLAIEGSYHGKTLGAYSLTWNAPGRDDLGLKGPFEVVWIPRDDEARAIEIFKNQQSVVETGDGTWKFSRIAGLFLEPVQGEGGIFPLSKSFVRTLRELADDSGCPIVVDEIQSGMGRTGAFAAASQIGLRGDYYLFGKSLGGGLSKTSALLIDSDRYAQGYGFAHTSTFGEDDHGALIALRALRLLDEDKVEARSLEAGAYLVKRLDEVRSRYGDVISDVRGCGLMVGIELSSQAKNDSQLISGLSEQKLLGIFIASHLLHRCGVRVGTALSRPSTLRFEPSAYISRADMDKTAQGVETVCRIIRNGDAADLVRHLAQGYRMGGQTPFRMNEQSSVGKSDAAVTCSVSSQKQAVFLGHMIDSDDIGLLDKSLLNLSVAERENLAERMSDPVLVKRVPMVSSCGDSINFELHTLPLTSRAIVSALRDGQSARIVDQVNSAVSRFADQGAQVVGLGGLLSVITRNGLSVTQQRKELQITTGNTYTVALAAEAVVRTVGELRLDPGCERVGVIGAGGNIGSTLAHIFSEQFHCMRLVGRKASIGRVERVADAIYDQALALLHTKGRQGVQGLAAALAGSKILDGLDLEPGRMNSDGLSSGARARRKVIEHYGVDPFLPVSTGMEALRDCSIVVSASNSIAPILNASNVGSATRIICDVSVPSDVDPGLSVARPDITIIRGGVAKAPDNNSFTFDMIDLPQNHMLACMTETALLGFSGKQGFNTTGDIHANGVRECHELGNKYGFGLGYFSLEKPFAVELS